MSKDKPRFGTSTNKMTASNIEIADSLEQIARTMRSIERKVDKLLQEAGTKEE